VVRVGQSSEDQFGRVRTWDQVINQNGPYDEPTFCYGLGRVFVQQGLYRQAIQQFERVRSLAQDDLASRQMLVNLYLWARLYDRVLEVVKEVQARPEVFGLTLTSRAELLSAEASARFGNGDVAGGRQLLETARTAHPTNSVMLSGAAQVYILHGDLTNALQVINDQLQLNPTDPAALGNKGYVYVQLHAYRDAIPPLTQLLNLQTNNAVARLNRAIAYLQSDDLEAAQRDYEDLHKQFPTAYQLHYGLAEIACRKRDTNSAIRYFQLYLSNELDKAEAKLVRERLQHLQPPGS
jgi:Flp pilus assembly protein TadD